MDENRRRLLKAAAGIAALAATPPVLQAAVRPGIHAVLFDAFTVFDPRPVAVQVKQMFPADGDALVELWRTKQFEYTWLRTLSGRYVGFWDVTRDALRFSVLARRLVLSNTQEDWLMGAYLELKTWPEVPQVLRTLKAAGVKLALLSNFTEEMLQANIRGAGLDEMFDQVLSTDRARAFKPDPRAYHLGLDAFGLPREAMLFAAFAGWDAAGAKSFGYPTFWVNRLNQVPEELGIEADATGNTLTELVSYTHS